MRIAIYARVSTDKQTAENQIVKLKEYAKLREYIVERVYTDPAVSGKRASRPELNLMKDKIKKGLIDGVLVWKLDRLGRSTQDLINLLEYFMAHNCEFISYNNNMDTTTAEGRLLFRIIASFAEFESDLISERTKLAYDRKEAHAKALGQKIKWGRKSTEFLDSEMLFIIECRSQNVYLGWRTIASVINERRDEMNKSLSKSKQLPNVSYSTIKRVFQNREGKNGGENNSKKA